MLKLLSLSVMILVGGVALGGEPAPLKVGDPAPDLTGTDQTGKAVKLSSFKDKQGVVVFFFPKAFTPGCTAESCGFRDEAQKYIDKGYVIFGASRDDGKKLTEFKEKYKLPYDLFSDPNGELSLALGIAPGKRETVVIGKDGKIEFIYKKVTAQTQPVDVLKDLDAKK